MSRFSQVETFCIFLLQEQFYKNTILEISEKGIEKLKQPEAEVL